MGKILMSRIWVALLLVALTIPYARAIEILMWSDAPLTTNPNFKVITIFDTIAEVYFIRVKESFPQFNSELLYSQKSMSSREEARHEHERIRLNVARDFITTQLAINQMLQRENFVKQQQVLNELIKQSGVFPPEEKKE